MLPDSEEDFGIFRRLITNQNVVFTSSWVDRDFGIKMLQQKCYHTEEKLRLIAEGDGDILMSEEFLSAYKKGIAASNTMTKVKVEKVKTKEDNEFY